MKKIQYLTSIVAILAGVTCSVAADAPAPNADSAPAAPANSPAAVPASTPAVENAAATTNVPVAVTNNGTNSLHLNFRGASLETVLNYLSEAAGFIINIKPGTS